MRFLGLFFSLHRLLVVFTTFVSFLALVFCIFLRELLTCYASDQFAGWAHNLLRFEAFFDKPCYIFSYLNHLNYPRKKYN